tara:strand:- start:55 stop:852 length:798 start_codon:yes stop_codon:yes gene_type:complete
MLKNRLIPVLFLKNGFLVRSEKFTMHKNIGNPIAQVQRYNEWDVDELIYIDITRSGRHDYKRSDLGGIDNNSTNSIEDIIRSIAQKCFMPFTFGGGIKTMQDARKRFELGADKITINTQALNNSKFITELANEFGSQAIVVSIDAKKNEKNVHKVYKSFGDLETEYIPSIWAKECQERGAGEILINSIERDGTSEGYDIELIKSVVDSTTIPVIACGGVGDYSDFAKGIEKCNASAVAAGNIFHFKELSYPLAKRQLKKKGYNFR